VCRRGLVV